MTGVSLVITFKQAAKMQIAKLSVLFVFISERLFDTVILPFPCSFAFQFKPSCHTCFQAQIGSEKKEVFKTESLVMDLLMVESEK